MQRILIAALASATLAAQAFDFGAIGNAIEQSVAPAAAPAATSNTTSAFIDKLGAARGQALSPVDALAVSSAVGGTQSMVDNAQNQFLDKVSQSTGLNRDVISAIAPKTTAPVSQSDVMQKLQAKTGQLNPQTVSVVQDAVQSRNSAMGNLRDTLVQNLASRVGVPATVVTALLPMVGL